MASALNSDVAKPRGQTAVYRGRHGRIFERIYIFDGISNDALLVLRTRNGYVFPKYQKERLCVLVETRSRTTSREENLLAPTKTTKRREYGDTTLEPQRQRRPFDGPLYSKMIIRFRESLILSQVSSDDTSGSDISRECRRGGAGRRPQSCFSPVRALRRVWSFPGPVHTTHSLSKFCTKFQNRVCLNSTGTARWRVREAIVRRVSPV